MKVAILGSGNGALAMAFEWSRAGHDVYMYDFPQFDRQIKAINEAGGIYSEGQMEAAPPSLSRVCLAPVFPLDLHSQPILQQPSSSSPPYCRVCVHTRTRSTTTFHSHHLRSSSHAHPILRQT